MNLLCCFMLALTSEKAPIAYLIDVIRVEKSFMLGHTKEIGVACTNRDSVYSVQLS